MLMLYQLYRYCVVGNEVILHSIAVSDSVFETNWIIADDDIQKSFLLMMMRAQRPIELTAAKFVILSLQTFMTVSYLLPQAVQSCICFLKHLLLHF